MSVWEWEGEHPWSSHNAHTMAHATLVGHTEAVGEILGPYHLICVLHWYWQNALLESRPVNI